MINKLTKADLRQILDKCKYATALDDDGDYYLIMSADANFDHDVVVYFVVNEEHGRLNIQSFPIDYEIDEADMHKAVYICNSFNSEYYRPIVHVNPRRRVIAQTTWFITDEVSEEYMMKEIKGSVSSMWSFFCRFKEEFAKL